MINMKRTAAEAKKLQECCSLPSETEAYPYGLEIRLDQDQLTKLGIDIAPAVGAEMMVMAKVIVTSSSASQTIGGEAQMHSCWQITDMEIGPVPAAKDAKAMYPNSQMSD